MPSLRTFRLEFDRQSATYMVGETVSGNVIVDIAKDKHARGLTLTAKGEAWVRWTETRSETNTSGQSSTRHDSYTNSENYFNFKYNVIQKSSSEVQIPAGLHKYPFNFKLPCNIPSSFEHQYGYVRYTVKATIDRPWKFDHETKAAFTVISSLDLNEHRHKCLGVDDEVMKNFYCCCCFHVGKINLRIRVPTSGYVSGQTIYTTLDYKNSSSVQVAKIYTKLIRKLKFHASTSAVKTDVSEIKSTKYSGSFSAREQNISDLLIPPIPPSNLQYCGIIDLEYKLMVSVHFMGPHLKLEKSYPILIGTVPLYFPPSAPPLNVISYTDTKEAAVFAAMPMPVQPSVPYPPTDAPIDSSSEPEARSESVDSVLPEQPSTSSTNWDIPPPSYEECVSGTQNIMDHDESNYVIGANDSFAPRYPVFNYPAPSIRDK